MFDGQVMTRREVMIARDAAARQRCNAQYYKTSTPPGHRPFHDEDGPCNDCRARASLLYPLKVERPRVVRDEHGGEWRVVRGALWYRLNEAEHGKDWQLANGVPLQFTVTQTRAALWAELFATPNEWVDDVPPSSPSGSGT